MGTVRLTYLGHSTVLIELNGVRLLTDPVLRSRVAHLERRAVPVDLRAAARPDVVLISHMHFDHFDPGSLRLVDRHAVLVVPPGAGKAAGLLSR